MNLSASLSLTPKGVEEVMNRAFKLSVRHRSVLIVLGKPQTIEHILQMQQIYHHDEIIETINDLVNEGFVAVNGTAILRATTSAPSGNIQLVDGITISEAKFLLIDFCVDSFGTQSQKYVDELGGCKNEKCLQLCLAEIYAATEIRSPDRLPALLEIVKEINAT